MEGYKRRMTASFDDRRNASDQKRRHPFKGMSGILSRFLLVAICLSVISIGSTNAFPKPATANKRSPLAVAVRIGQRKRPFATRDEIELWKGFDRGEGIQPTDTGSTTSLRLFFNKRDEFGNLIKKEKTKRRAKPTDETLDNLRSPGISFPKSVRLSNAKDVSLSLRCMTTEDLKALVPMCIEEFGSESLSKKHTSSQNGSNNRRRLPRWIPNPSQIPDLWEEISFEMLIYYTLRLKLIQGGNSRHSDLQRPRDPVMLVLCEQKQKQPSHMQGKINPVVSRENEVTDSIVGMVELSLQPPDADRNPPAYPLPLWAKAVLAKFTTLDGSLQGWVTNLLIDDSCRGKGYSKILMAAVEGIAKHKWGCSSVYLHADADIRSGKIPQSLYEGLGYDLVIGSTRKDKKKSNGNKEDPTAKFEWMGVSGKELERMTAIRMVDEVALLCYRKPL